MAKLKTTLTGFGWDKTAGGRLSTAPIPIEVGQPFSDTIVTNSIGSPITLEAFLMMLKKFLDKTKSQGAEGNESEDIYAFRVSKASLLRILSQEDCEVLQFFFVIPDDQYGLSLAIAGKDKNDNFIHPDSFVNIADDIESKVPLRPISFDKSPALDEKVGKNKLNGITSIREIVRPHAFDNNYTLKNLIQSLGGAEG